MTSKEFSERLNELTAQVRNAYIEMHELIPQYESAWDSSDGLESYHAIQRALYDFYLNGAQLVDDYTKTDIGTPKSCVYKSRQILNKKKI